MLLPRRIPFVAAEPADVVLVSESAYPVDLVDAELRPERDVWRLGRIGRPVTRIRMVIEVAAQRFLGQVRVLSYIENVKVAKEGDARLGRHASSPRRSLLLPVTRVVLGSMAWIRNSGVRVGRYADRGVLGLAVEHVPPGLRDGQPEVEERARPIIAWRKVFGA